MKQFIVRVYREVVPTNLKSLFSSLKKIPSYPQEIARLKHELRCFRILYYLEHNSSDEYKNEIAYEIEHLNRTGTLAVFPYQRTNKESNNIEGYFDRKRKMPYVFHNGKRLYFPKQYDVERAKQTYFNFIVSESILGGGYRVKAPHQYTTESFIVKDDDIVLDIGAAEGLFLLNVIDKVKKGYLFESDKSWIGPLNATFEPYKDKVKIINKLASDKDSLRELTIDTCLKNEYGNIFIKMDVEGYENLVLNGAKAVLNRENDIRVACCTYHRHDDANLLGKFFKDINYKTEFSDGYMLFHYDKNLKPPFFRKGLIRATKANVEL